MSTDSGSFGDWLRRQRELREISLRDIAERTKISLRYLEANTAAQSRESLLNASPIWRDFAQSLFNVKEFMYLR